MELLKFTHTHSGQAVHIKAASIDAVCEGDFKTLVLFNGQGMYVKEQAEDIRQKVELALKNLKNAGVRF